MSVERIIATALETVDEVGAQAFNMRMLAERLGSGTATLYRHFASKDEILIYVVDSVLGECTDQPEVAEHAPQGRGSGGHSWQKAWRIRGRAPLWRAAQASGHLAVAGVADTHRA
ncbi:helix-turn-helix transcriptional regulator [Pseudomonas syringae pv. actinidiae]|nr:helix-turn-helix transcriptional regulator [Pseudomonas syringae pv. actinidiae]